MDHLCFHNVWLGEETIEGRRVQPSTYLPVTWAPSMTVLSCIQVCTRVCTQVNGGVPCLRPRHDSAPTMQPRFLGSWVWYPGRKLSESSVDLWAATSCKDSQRRCRINQKHLARWMINKPFYWKDGNIPRILGLVLSWKFKGYSRVLYCAHNLPTTPPGLKLVQFPARLCMKRWRESICCDEKDTSRPSREWNYLGPEFGYSLASVNGIYTAETYYHNGCWWTLPSHIHTYMYVPTGEDECHQFALNTLRKTL